MGSENKVERTDSMKGTLSFFTHSFNTARRGPEASGSLSTDSAMDPSLSKNLNGKNANADGRAENIPLRSVVLEKQEVSAMSASNFYRAH